MKLFTYSHSSASQRVRTALNYKGIVYESIPLELNDDSLKTPEYLRLNPQGMVPALLDTSEGVVITQSMSILEYLEEKYPERPLLPSDMVGRARVRTLANIVADDIHPLNNRRVFAYLNDKLDVDVEQRKEWFNHWTTKGFVALERALTEQPGTGDFAHGNTPTLADLVIVPSVHRADRHGVNLADYPTLRGIYRTCMTLPAFQAAAPETQADAV